MARSDPQINIRVPADLKQQLELLAVQNGRSLNAEVVLRLENSLSLKLENSLPLKIDKKKISPANPHTMEAYLQYLVNLMKSAKDWDDFQQKLNDPYPPKDKPLTPIKDEDTW